MLALIDVWLLRPIAAAAVVSAIPITTALAGRAVRGHSLIVSAAVGAALVAVGLVGLSLLTHRQVGGVIVMLALVGTGLGLAFPPLTAAALRSGGPASARAAKTVAARDAGIVVGLLILTPIFVHQLNRAPDQALPAATTAVLTAPIPDSLKSSLAPGLLADYRRTPQGQVPDFGPTFAQAGAHATRSRAGGAQRPAPATRLDRPARHHQRIPAAAALRRDLRRPRRAAAQRAAHPRQADEAQAAPRLL